MADPLITSNLAQAIINCAQGDQDLYTPSETLPADMVGPIDIVLSDGSIVTLSAGDVIPANSISDVYVDEITGEAACISKSIANQDLFLTGATLPATMTTPVEIVLADGSVVTLNAGDVIPANSISSVYVDEVTGQSVCISKYAPDQDLFNPNDTLPADMVGTVDVILEDGTTVTLAAGDVVPATSTGAVYVDEVTGAPRCIGDKLTKELLVADFPAGVCDPAIPVEVLTAACEKLNIKDLIPVCIVTECEFAGELGSVGSVPAPVLDLQMTEVQTGQSGFLVAGSPDSFIDAPVDVSPTFAINPDCVYSLQVTYGGNSNPLPCNPTLNISGTTGLSAPRQLTYDKGVQANGTNTTYSVKESIYLFDGATGVPPTIDLDFLQLGGATSVVSYSWAEICDTTGEVVRSNYFSAPICSDSNILTGNTDGPYDLGGCDSLIFSSARHVAYNPDGGFATEGTDTDWFQHSLDGAGFTTAYEWTSLNHPSACQLGHLGGILDAGSGSWTWDSTANNLDTQHGAVMTAATLNCENAGDGLLDSVESCSVDSENTNCLCDAMIECVFKGSVKLCAEEGTTITAVPVINGIAQTTQAASASDGQCIDHQIDSSFLDTSLILPPGGVYTSTASWQFTGTGSYETTNTKLTCKVIPS